VLAIGGLGLMVVVGLLTARGQLHLGVGALVAAAGLAFAYRYPTLALCAYAATIPLETVQIEGLATISRAVGAAFFIGYVLANRGIRLDAVRVSAWIFVGLATMSVLWSVGQNETIASLSTLLQLLAITVMVADATSRDAGLVRPVLWAYAAAATITSVLAIAAYATNRTSLIAGRAGAFAEQDVAQFAGLVVPALVFVIVQASTGDRRVLAGIATVLCGMAVLLSGTRSAWLAVAAALFLAVLPRLRPNQVVALVLLVGLVAVGAAQLPGVADALVGRIGSAVETGGAGRLDIWAVGFAIFTSNPVAGVGYAAFPVAFTADVIRAAAIPGLDTAVLSGGRGSHSLLLATAAELGALGLLALAWMVRDVLRPGVPPFGAVVQAMVVGVLVQALFLDVLGRKQVWLIFGLAFGLDYARRRVAGRATGSLEPVTSQETMRAPPSRGGPQPEGGPIG
jgi:exopolysaccharide production protein ExoQ